MLARFKVKEMLSAVDLLSAGELEEEATMCRDQNWWYA